MALTSILACTLIAQQKPFADASLVWTGLPRFEQADAVRTNLHSATVELVDLGYRIRTLTLFRNTTNLPVTARLIIPTYREPEWLRSFFNWRVIVDNRPAVPEVDDPKAFAIAFRPGATVSVRTEAVLPLGHAGMRNTERIFAYQLPQLPQAEPVQQVHIAVRYTPEQVFRTTAHEPRGWQIGPRGAFLKMDRVRLDRPMTVFLRWYPGGFELLE